MESSIPQETAELYLEQLKACRRRVNELEFLLLQCEHQVELLQKELIDAANESELLKNELDAHRAHSTVERDS